MIAMIAMIDKRLAQYQLGRVNGVEPGNIRLSLEQACETLPPSSRNMPGQPDPPISHGRSGLAVTTQFLAKWRDCR